MKAYHKKEIEIPTEVKVNIEEGKIIVEGPVDKLERNFKLKKIVLKKEGDKVIIECEKATKREKKMINTIAAHIKNMIQGVINPFEYKLQIYGFKVSRKIAIV